METFLTLTIVSAQILLSYLVIFHLNEDSDFQKWLGISEKYLAKIVLEKEKAKQWKIIKIILWIQLSMLLLLLLLLFI